MRNRKVIALGALAASIAVGTVIMGADAKKSDSNFNPPHEAYDPTPPFAQAMEQANDKARGDPQAMEKAAREGDAARDKAGVSHKGEVGLDGTISPDKGPTVGASVSKDQVEVHVTIDAAKPAPPEHTGEAAEHNDNGGQFKDGGFTGSDVAGTYSNTA